MSIYSFKGTEDLQFKIVNGFKTLGTKTKSNSQCLYKHDKTQPPDMQSHFFFFFFSVGAGCMKLEVGYFVVTIVNRIIFNSYEC